jgi:hypothetical protein
MKNMAKMEVPMKKMILYAALVFAVVTSPAFAAHGHKAKHHDHALGNMYTKALNLIESQGLLDTLEPKKRVKITDIHMDYGQVFVTLGDENPPIKFVYDPIANSLVK